MRRALLGLLVLVPLVPLWPALTGGEIFAYEDLAAQYLPREQLLLRAPGAAWNPHEFLGMGLYDDPQTAAYEPVRAFARAVGLDASAGLCLFLAVYLVVATVGYWAWARRLGASPLGATLVVLSAVWGGLYMVRFHHPWMFGALCLLPLVALLADRLGATPRLRWALLLAVVIALGALSGHPQPPYISWLFAAGWALLRAGRRALLAVAWRLAVAGVAFVGLLAGYYAPVVEALWTGARRHAGLAFAGSFSWKASARLLAPDLLGSDMAGSYYGPPNFHEQLLYLGLAPSLLLLLALLWRRRDPERRLLGVGVTALVLAAGRFLPLFYVCYYLLPGFRLFRAPCRFLFVFVLCAATVSGLVLTRIEAGERPPDAPRLRRWLRRAALLGPLAAPLVLLAPPAARAHTAWVAARALALLVAGGVVLERWLADRLRGPSAAQLLVALTALDLALAWLPYHQTRPRAEALPPATIVAALVDASPARVLVHSYWPGGGPRIEPLLNWGEAAGYDDLRGYNQAAPGDLLALLGIHDTGELAPCDPADWLLDLAGVARIAAPAAEWPARWASLPLVAAERGWQVRQRSGFLPRAWLVPAAETLARDAILDRLPTIDPRRLALVEEPIDLPAASGADAGRVTLRDPLALDVEARVPALLVVADRFARGWRVTVDGAAARLLRADYLLRAVRLSPGVHRVRFAYEVPGRRPGLYLSAITALLIALGLVVTRRP